MDSERIAEHIAAFEKSGGRVEKLGVTRVLQKVSEVAATAPGAGDQDRRSPPLKRLSGRSRGAPVAHAPKPAGARARACMRRCGRSTLTRSPDDDATRSPPSPPASTLIGDAALVRAVGSFALTAAVINVIVGGGIFRMPSALSAQMGVAAPLALVAGALAIIPVALCFAAIGSRVQVTGGPYSYLSATFGPFAGFLAGALMWISNFTSSAGVAAALSVQVASLVPALAPAAAARVAADRRVPAAVRAQCLRRASSARARSPRWRR